MYVWLQSWPPRANRTPTDLEDDVACSGHSRVGWLAGPHRHSHQTPPSRVATCLCIDFCSPLFARSTKQTDIAASLCLLVLIVLVFARLPLELDETRNQNHDHQLGLSISWLAPLDPSRGWTAKLGVSKTNGRLCLGIFAIPVREIPMRRRQKQQQQQQVVASKQ